MQLIANDGNQNVPVVYDHRPSPQPFILMAGVEAPAWLNKNAAPAINRQGLKAYLNSRMNKEAHWHLTLPKEPHLTPETMEVLGVSYVQQRVFIYDGLLWTMPTEVPWYDITKFPAPNSQMAPTHVVPEDLIPPFKEPDRWAPEVFVGSYEKHLPPDLVTKREIPVPLLGRY